MLLQVCMMCFDSCYSNAAVAKQSTDASTTVGQPGTGDVDMALSTVPEVDPPCPGGSNASTMSNVSSYNEHESNGSSVCSGGEEHTIKEYEIVRNILYATRENINIIHEVFRQVEFINYGSDRWNYFAVDRTEIH